MLLAIVLTTIIATWPLPSFAAAAISWTPCVLNETASIPPAQQVQTECGSISVPLDYTNPTSETTQTLQLVRVLAPQQPSKGSIIINFGGPGESGYAYVAMFGQRLQAIAGAEHDIVLLVPRGTAPGSLPFECYNSTEARERDGLVRRIITGSAYDVALNDIWANAGAFAETCAHARNETGGLISSTFTARDIMGLVDALDEDGMLRYWGFSYGTFLGSILAAMFPERIDRMVLDGVINGHENQNGVDIEGVVDADKAFSGFCSACVEAGSDCAAAKDMTASQLEDAVYAGLEDLKLHPIPFYIPDAGAFVLNYDNAKFFLYFGLYYTSSWPSLAKFVDAFMRRDQDGLYEYVAAFVGSGGQTANSNQAVETLLGIRCGDVVTPRTSALEELRPLLEARISASKIGGDVDIFVNANCAQWKIPTKERYDGDFKSQTKNPVLFVGNTADPVTPLASAQNMSSSLLGSVVLQHDSYGHTTLLSQASLCTARRIKSYFDDGVLPDAGTICPIDVPRLSSDDGWNEVVAELSESQRRSVEDNICVADREKTCSAPIFR